MAKGLKVVKSENMGVQMVQGNRCVMMHFVTHAQLNCYRRSTRLRASGVLIQVLSVYTELMFVVPFVLLGGGNVSTLIVSP